MLTDSEIEILRSPAPTPKANAHAERWIGTVRRECLDRLLTVSECQLRSVVADPEAHCNSTVHTGPVTNLHPCAATRHPRPVPAGAFREPPSSAD